MELKRRQAIMGPGATYPASAQMAKKNLDRVSRHQTLYIEAKQ